ncbi:MAG: hypothetical protein VX090_00315, partial [Pseudomonadota bacterium]|nr:hypothetical protein [Pseudomonadota bacterium]
GADDDHSRGVAITCLRDINMNGLFYLAGSGRFEGGDWEARIEACSQKHPSRIRRIGCEVLRRRHCLAAIR